MTTVNVYDDTAKLLEEASEDKDITVAGLIDMLLDFIDEV